MWILMLVLLLLGAQLNPTAIVPLQAGGTPPPWWVGGRLLWPFAVETRTLIPPGDVLNTLTPILGIMSATVFLLAAAALLRWVVPGAWFGHHPKCCVVTSSNQISTAASRRTFSTGSDSTEKCSTGLHSR
jgi:hypothetical protein